MLKKKYYLMFVAAAALVASSCTDKNAYTITGTVAGVDAPMAYLSKVDQDWRTKIVVDSAAIENGTFEFKGVADSSLVKFISFERDPKPSRDKKINVFPVIAEPGVIIFNYAQEAATIGGTAFNDKLNEIVALRAKEKVEQQEAENTVFSFLTTAGIPQEIATYVYMSNRGAIKDVAKMEQVLPLLSETFLATRDGIRAKAIVETVEGKQFTELTAKTPTGEDISLSSYIGGNNKYTLVDFWASWCPPCRAEMPELVKIYSEYKAKGFEVVGVSLDDKNENWQKAIDDFKITWPQMSDLKRWGSDLSNQYNIGGIPHMILIDGEGKIIKRGIGTKELRTELETLLP